LLVSRLLARLFPREQTVYKPSFGDIFMQSDSAVVAVVRGERGHEPVFKALDLIDYKRALEGYDRVLIKVNFITTQTPP
jgi:hypothetical protein